MKILFVAEYYAPIIKGGAEISLKMMVDILSKDGHDITVLTPNYEKEITDVTKINNTTIIRFKSFRSKLYKSKGKTMDRITSYSTIHEIIKSGYMIASAIELYLRAKQILNSTNFDVVHANNIESQLAVSVLKTKAKKILHVRDGRQLYSNFEILKEKISKETISDIKRIFKINWTQALPIKIMCALKLKSVKQFDKYITITEYMKELLIANKVNQSKITTVYNPYQSTQTNRISDKKKLRKELGIKTKNPIILYVGGLEKIKGIHNMPKIIQNNKDKHFIIVGDGPYFQYMKNKNYNNLTLTGSINQSETIKYYKISDIFIYPLTQPIGTGRVILESFSEFLPVLAFKNKGISDVLIDNKTALLVDHRSQSDIKEKLNDLIKDNVLKSKLTIYAHKFLHKNCSVGEFSKKIIEEFK